MNCFCSWYRNFRRQPRDTHYIMSVWGEGGKGGGGAHAEQIQLQNKKACDKIHHTGYKSDARTLTFHRLTTSNIMHIPERQSRVLWLHRCRRRRRPHHPLLHRHLHLRLHHHPSVLAYAGGTRWRTRKPDTRQRNMPRQRRRAGVCITTRTIVEEG